MRVPRPLTVITTLALMAASAGSAHAQLDTLESGSGRFGAPAVAARVWGGDILPTKPIVHVVWTRDFSLRHAAKEFDPWQIETVADSAVFYDVGVNGDGLATIALCDSSGRLIFGEQTMSGWVRDTILTEPGSLMRVSVAPRGEPAIAWVEYSPPDAFGLLRYARRVGPSWSITEVDTFMSLATPSLVIGADSRPRIAAVPWADGPTLHEVTCYEGAGPLGPFDRAVVDTEGVGPVSLVWEDVHQRPIVSYGARRTGDFDLHRDYKLAWRDAASVWHPHEIVFPNSVVTPEISMALDPVGMVGVLWDDPGSYLHPYPHFARQPPGVPTEPLDPEEPLSGSVQALFGTKSVASHQYGKFDLCWREPRFASSDYAIVHQEIDLGTTAVPEPPAGAPLHLDVSPTPRRAGETVLVRWSQSRTAEARLTAFDVSGRVVMSHAPGNLPAGAHEYRWTPAALAPGVYWIALRLDGRQVARRVLVSR